jgi:hypothetical protein
LTFFWGAFLGVSRFSARGVQIVQKHHTNIFAKSPCRKLFPKKSTKILMSVVTRLFFWFIAFSGVSQRWEFKNTQKNVLQKTSCRKVFTKNSTKKSKTDYFSIFFNHVFGRFSVREFKNTIKQDRKNESDPIPFLYSDLPATGASDFCFCRPLVFVWKSKAAYTWQLATK